MRQLIRGVFFNFDFSDADALISLQSSKVVGKVGRFTNHDSVLNKGVHFLMPVRILILEPWLMISLAKQDLLIDFKRVTMFTFGVVHIPGNEDVCNYVHMRL